MIDINIAWDGQMESIFFHNARLKDDGGPVVRAVVSNGHKPITAWNRQEEFGDMESHKAMLYTKLIAQFPEGF